MSFMSRQRKEKRNSVNRQREGIKFGRQFVLIKAFHTEMINEEETTTDNTSENWLFMFFQRIHLISHLYVPEHMAVCWTTNLIERKSWHAELIFHLFNLMCVTDLISLQNKSLCSMTGKPAQLTVFELWMWISMSSCRFLWFSCFCSGADYLKHLPNKNCCFRLSSAITAK